MDARAEEAVGADAGADAGGGGAEEASPSAAPANGSGASRATPPAPPLPHARYHVRQRAAASLLLAQFAALRKQVQLRQQQKKGTQPPPR